MTDERVNLLGTAVAVTVGAAAAVAQGLRLVDWWMRRK